MNTRDDLRKWLDQELQAPGRSQSGLARFMGLDQSAVNRIVSGKRAIKAHELPVIERYLAETSKGRETRVEGLTAGQLSKRRSALAAFPSVLGAVAASSVSIDDLAELTAEGRDYPVVMILARDLEDAVSTSLISRIAAIGPKFADLEDLLGRGEKSSALRGAEFLERIHVIGPDELRKVTALLALRDALVQSRRELTLFDPAVRELVEMIALPAEDDGELWRGSGLLARNQFLMGALVLIGAVRGIHHASDESLTA